MSKQMRVSDDQHKILGQLEKALKRDRAEILNNMIALLQKCIANNAIAIKIVCKNGEEKEVLLTLFAGESDEG